MISFTNIPLGRLTPGQFIEFDASRATNGAGLSLNRVLLVGQRRGNQGAAAELTPVSITSADEAVQQFGAGSMLAQMAAAYLTADRTSPVTAIALEDPAGGTAATGTLALTGPATAAGSIKLRIGGEAVNANIRIGDSAAQIAQRVAVAINQLPNNPVVAAIDGDNVGLTARHLGVCGNDIDVRLNHLAGERLPGGVAAVITAMAGGAGEPDYSAIWPVIGDTDYRTIIFGGFGQAIYLANVDELAERWGEERQLEGTLYAAANGTQGELSTLGDTLNSELVSVIGAASSPSLPWVIAADYGAACGSNSLADPARPLQTLALPNITAPREGESFTRAERELLLASGIATFTADRAGTVRIERAVTTYKTNAAGLSDLAYLDLEAVLTLAYLRRTLRARIASKYQRFKLASDGNNFARGQNIVTPSLLRAELIALAREWEEDGLVENVDQFINDLIVERNSNDTGRIDALVPPNIVNQFRSFAASIQFRL